MPKETFFNLPEQKRKTIENSAQDEFAQYGYDAASVNRIVEKSGIAKGSFYQYFEDKKDVFLHLMNQTVSNKLKYLSPIVVNYQEHGLFVVIRELFISGLQYAKENPKGIKIADWLMRNTHHEVYQELMATSGAASDDFYITLFKQAQERNEIREGLDIDFLGHMMTGLGKALAEYYYKQNENAGFTDSDKMMVLVDKMIDLIKFGLKKQGGHEND